MTRSHLLDEIFSSITHGICLLAFIAGAALFFIFHHANLLTEISVSVFFTGIFSLYGISTLYHSLSFTKAQKVFSRLDQSCIFLLIAATYTPFLISIHKPYAWILLSIIWIIAITGMTLKSIFPEKYTAVTLISYLLLGWIGVMAIKPLAATFSPTILFYLILGGLGYSAGTLFFVFKKIPFNHTIWHVFVFLGSAMHFMAILSLS